MEEKKNCLIRKIGKTTFVINIMKSETAKKALYDKFRELCIHAALESGQTKLTAEDQASPSTAIA